VYGLTVDHRAKLTHFWSAASTIAECAVKIAALERKVGQLTMELDLVKTARSRTARASEPSLPTSGTHPREIAFASTITALRAHGPDQALQKDVAMLV
jgi:hypothetical protein